jgi:CubicO group peptidase (beta-lactamase class C family)
MIRRLISVVALAVGPVAAQAADSAVNAASPAPVSRFSGRAGAFNFGDRPTQRQLAAYQSGLRAAALCSGLWDGGRTVEQIHADNDGIEGLEPATVDIDAQRRIVRIRYSDAMPPRIVVWRRVLGCVQLPIGATEQDISGLPQVADDVIRPDLDAREWPTGDRNATGRLPRARQQALAALVDKAFDGKTYGGRTWGIIVVKDGKIVAEKYGMGFDLHQAAQTNSASKSFASTIVGIATSKYGLDIDKAPALAEWNVPGDPRSRITGRHLLNMASGLYTEGDGNPQGDIYAGGATVAGRAVTNGLDTQPGTRFIYSPPDTMLLMRSVRQQVNNDEEYWALPFQQLFWKIGMTRTTPASDWNGDFLMSGQTYSNARDFARFGLLYLNEGMWGGERILPEGWSKYVRTPAPRQPTGSGARYGAQFWIYTGIEGLNTEAYSPNGGQGQYAMILPEHRIVVVRRGFDADGGFRIARFSADVVAALN